jgi:hypothetical protein
MAKVKFQAIRVSTIDEITLKRRRLVARLKKGSTVKVFTDKGRQQSLGTIKGIDWKQGFLYIRLEKGGKPRWYVPEFVERY